MAAGEATGIPALHDCESARTVTALEVLEAVDGYGRRAGGKLEEARLALRGP